MFKLIFIIIIFTFSAYPIFTQQKDSFGFEKCWELNTGTPPLKASASDNKTNLITFSNSNSVFTIDKNGNLIWKTEISNEEIEKLILAKGKVIVLTKTNDNKTHTIKNLSLDTGITKWKIEEVTDENIKLLKIFEHQNNIIVVYSDGKFKKINSESGQYISINNYQNTESILKVLHIENQFVYYLNDKNKIMMLNIETDQNEIINIHIAEAIDGLYKFENYLFIISEIGKIYALSERNFVKLWTLQTGAGITNILDNKKDLIIFSKDNFIYSVSKTSGNKKWKYKSLSRVDGLIDGSTNNIITTNLNEPIAYVIDNKGKSISQLILDEDNFFTAKPYQISNQTIYFTKQRIISYSQNKC